MDRYICYCKVRLSLVDPCNRKDLIVITGHGECQNGSCWISCQCPINCKVTLYSLLSLGTGQSKKEAKGLAARRTLELAKRSLCHWRSHIMSQLSSNNMTKNLTDVTKDRSDFTALSKYPGLCVWSLTLLLIITVLFLVYITYSVCVICAKGRRNRNTVKSYCTTV